MTLPHPLTSTKAPRCLLVSCSMRSPSSPPASGSFSSDKGYMTSREGAKTIKGDSEEGVSNAARVWPPSERAVSCSLCRRPSSFWTSELSVRGYDARSSCGANCVGLTNNVRTVNGLFVKECRTT
jgi:hypothetical protein